MNPFRQKQPDWLKSNFRVPIPKGRLIIAAAPIPFTYIHIIIRINRSQCSITRIAWGTPSKKKKLHLFHSPVVWIMSHWGNDPSKSAQRIHWVSGLLLSVLHSVLHTILSKGPASGQKSSERWKHSHYDSDRRKRKRLMTHNSYQIVDKKPQWWLIWGWYIKICGWY